MKENRKLDNQEIENVSGGGWGSNKYPKDKYHEAGFITQWTIIPIFEDVFYLRVTANTKSRGISHENANKYVDYYLTHSLEEYIQYVQRIFPNYTNIIKGYDCL